MKNNAETISNCRVDEQLCNGCGWCDRVCPSDVFTIENKLAVPDAEKCISCGHCAAACPEMAISLGMIDPEASSFSSFSPSESWTPFGKPESAAIIDLMLSRRSCRNYSEKPVSKELLEDLVKIGATAPSGTNCQMWSFTVIPDRKSVLALGDLIADFFRRLNKMAGNPLARLVAKIFLKDALGEYYRGYYEKVKEALVDYEKTGKDLLFHGAPAVILVGGADEATTSKDDALLAAENILLAAHALGLGTCLIGFAVEALANDKRIGKRLDLPPDEKVYAVIAVGKSREKYQRPAGRKKISLRYFEA